MRLWLLAIQCPRLQMKADFHPDTLKWNVHMCLMLLLFIAASLQHVGFHLMPFLTICNLKKIFKALHSQRVQVPIYREQMDVIIQGHLSASSELLVSGFNCFDWCLRWKHLELAVAACSDFFRLLQTPYSACCLRHTAGYHYKFFLQNFFFLINTIILFFTLPPKTKHCTGTHVEIYKLFEHQCS